MVRGGRLGRSMLESHSGTGEAKYLPQENQPFKVRVTRWETPSLVDKREPEMQLNRGWES